MYLPEVYFKHAFVELNIMGCGCCNNTPEGVRTPRALHTLRGGVGPCVGRVRCPDELHRSTMQDIAIPGKNWSVQVAQSGVKGLIDLFTSNCQSVN